MQTCKIRLTLSDVNPCLSFTIVPTVMSLLKLINFPEECREFQSLIGLDAQKADSLKSLGLIWVNLGHNGISLTQN